MRFLAALLSMLLLASAGQAETTGNLLGNPGAETGTTEPWNTDDEVQAGPLTIGGATLDATEGTHWFVADKHINITQGPRPGFQIDFLSQVIDLRGLGTIESLTLRGDFFGAGEVVSGSATDLEWRVEVNAYFYDEDEQVLDGAFFVSAPVPLGALEAFPDLTFSADTVPAGTATVEVQYLVSLATEIRPTDVLPVDVHVAIGSDDLVVTATAVHNLLENPGAETGTTEPWGTSDGVREGPLMIGDATLDATEGTHWFVADEHVGITQVTQGTGYLILYLTQAVDLRGLGTIESVTLRGDLFGAGEVLSGSASVLEWQAEYFVTFLDEHGQAIDGTSFVSQAVPLGPLQAFDDLTFSVDSVPAATASVELQYSGSLLAVVGPADALPVDVHIAIGIDDLVFTATAVPEPAAASSAAAALAALGALARATGRGRNRD